MSKREVEEWCEVRVETDIGDDDEVVDTATLRWRVAGSIREGGVAHDENVAGWSDDDLLNLGESLSGVPKSRVRVVRT